MYFQYPGPSTPRANGVSYLQVPSAPRLADLSLGLVNDNQGVSYFQDPTNTYLILLVSGPQPRLRARLSRNFVTSPGPADTSLRHLGPLQKENVRKLFPKTFYKTHAFPFHNTLQNHFKNHFYCANTFIKPKTTF